MFQRTVAAVIIGCILLLIVGCDSDKIARLEKENQELKAELKKRDNASQIFTYQERCAEQSRKTFKDLGFDKKELASYENHYNPTMNKCFIEIMDNERARDGEFFTSRNISDALEGKVYGEYLWETKKNKKYWEVPPLMCRVVSPSGEEKRCTSEDEFKALMKPYMDIS